MARVKVLSLHLLGETEEDTIILNAMIGLPAEIRNSDLPAMNHECC